MNRRTSVLAAAALVGGLFGGQALLLGGARGATCETFTWGFDDASDLTLNADAGTAVTPDGTVLRVTPALNFSAGSAFTTAPITLADDASFSSFFSFRFSDQGNTGADGVVFVVQTTANDVGGLGGGIGYEGIDNSVGVEFDNWDNGGQDASSANHVGIDINGSMASDPLAEMPWALDDPTIVHHAWIDYDGSTDSLEVRVAQANVRPAAAILTKTVDLVSVLGSTDAFVGFTSGTGIANANHDVISWQLNSCFAPVGVSTTSSTTTEPPTSSSTTTEPPTSSSTTAPPTSTTTTTTPPSSTTTTTPASSTTTTPASSTTTTAPRAATVLKAEPALVRLIPGLRIYLGDMRATLTSGGAPVVGAKVTMTTPGGTKLCSDTTDVERPGPLLRPFRRHPQPRATTPLTPATRPTCRRRPTDR